MDETAVTESSLTECLGDDHRRLDALLAACKDLASTGAFADAIERFAAFSEGLLRHIDAEEWVLFPALADSTPLTRGPIRVMRAEHHQLREALVAIDRALKSRDSAWRAPIDEIEERLQAHNQKEEMVLYPMADRAARSLPELGTLSARLAEALEGGAKSG
jgi:hemerythrin-like domain-containing protein